MKLKTVQHWHGKYNYHRRRVMTHTYFNILWEQYRKTVNGKGVTHFSQWDGKTWQTCNWSKGRRIENLIKEGYGKRAKRQPR